MSLVSKEKFKHSVRSKRPTSVNDAMHIVQVCEALQHGQRDFGHHFNINGPNPLVNPVQRALILELHANADVGIRDERAVKGDDVFGMAVVHDL